MRQLQPVVWAKGTFLTPQHLQAQDRFLENLLQFRIDTLNFRPWGFSNLEIDREALPAGDFTIKTAQGLMPDGLPFDIPGSDAPPAQKSLEEYFEGDRISIDIFLAIPAHVEGGLNISMPTGGADTRYLSEVIDIRDENTGLSEKPVQVARKNLRFLAGEEAREGTPALKVARVQRNDAGLFELDPAFIPPLLNISASDRLVSIARGLLEILVARSSMLAGMRRQKNRELADFTASDIANFWLLFTINSHLPLFRHILESRRGHPEAVYSAMNSIAGALTTFSKEIEPLDLPAYDHGALGECFDAMDEKLRELLDTVVPTNFVSLPLKLEQPSIYATALDDEKYLQNTQMYLAVKSGLQKGSLIGRAPQLMKVCSATHIDHLIRQALGGVSMRHVAAPPASIPMKLDYEYFSLSQSGPAWEAVQRARNFAVYVPAEITDPQLELVILFE
jgi:type VI secretion system protein ImpJ